MVDWDAATEVPSQVPVGTGLPSVQSTAQVVDEIDCDSQVDPCTSETDTVRVTLIKPSRPHDPEV